MELKTTVSSKGLFGSLSCSAFTLIRRMTLEKQVCSLELAKRLKELGVPQVTSLFTWVKSLEEDEDCKGDYKVIILGNAGFKNYYAAGRDNKEIGEMFAAFTVAELGKILPLTINKVGLPITGMPWRLCCERYPDSQDWVCSYRSGKLTTSDQWSLSEADARAKMIIYLLENKLITP